MNSQNIVVSFHEHKRSGMMCECNCLFVFHRDLHDWTGNMIRNLYKSTNEQEFKFTIIPIRE